MIIVHLLHQSFNIYIELVFVLLYNLKYVKPAFTVIYKALFELTTVDIAKEMLFSTFIWSIPEKGTNSKFQVNF